MSPVGHLAVRPFELADEFYLLAHHNVSGAALLHQRAVDIGLAGCLLGELLLSGWATVELVDAQPIVTALDRREVELGDLVTQSDRPARVPLDRGVWNTVVREPRRLPVRQWLAVLGHDAAEQVADRLVEAGHLKVGRSRRSPPAPVSWSVAGGPASRLWAYLHWRNKEPGDRGLPPVHDVVLLALADAAGLSGVVLSGHEDEDGHARSYYAELLALLAQHYPMYSDLAAQTGAAIASAVATR